MTPALQEAPPCEHGERTDRLTRDGLPVCALCRRPLQRAVAALEAIPAPLIDTPALAAGDLDSTP